jgi:hypothetical protein
MKENYEPSTEWINDPRSAGELPHTVGSCGADGP